MRIPRFLGPATLIALLVAPPASAQDWRRLYGNDYGSVDIRWSHGVPSFGVVTHRWTLRSTFRAPIRICFTFIRITEGRQEREESIAELQPGVEKRDQGWWTMSQSSQDPPIVEAKDCTQPTGNTPPRQPQPPPRGPMTNTPAPSPPPVLPPPVPPTRSRDAIQQELDRQLQRLGRQGSLGTTSSGATGAAVNQGLDGLRDALNSYFEQERANRQAAYDAWERFQDQLERRQQEGSDLYFQTIRTMEDSAAEYGAAAARARQFLDQTSRIPEKPVSLSSLNSQTRKAYEARHKGCTESQYWEMFECVSAGDILLAAGQRRLAESYYARACEMDQGIGCAQLVRSVAARDEWLLARALVRTASGCNGAEAQACLALYRPLWEVAGAAAPPAPAAPPLAAAPPPGIAVPGTEWRVTRIRLHEGPEAGVRWDQQRYATRFQLAELRLLYVGLVLGGRAGAPLQAQVRCTTTGPSGVFNSDTELRPDPTWSAYEVTVPAVGWAEPGRWMLGSYRVSCRTGDVILAETSFEVSQRLPGTEWEVTALRLFEGPDGGVPYEQQRLTNVFSRPDTRRIHIRLDLAGRAGAPLNARVACVMTGSFGKVDTEVQLAPDPAWASFATYTKGVGWSTAGSWPVGFYGVACSSGGVMLGAWSFAIVQPIAGTEWQVGEIKTYGGPDAGVAYGQRQYVTSFRREELRRLFVELALAGRPGAPLSGRVDCAITGPDAPGSVSLDLRPDPTWGDFVVTTNGWGWTDPGHWVPGEYTVTCSMGQLQLAARSFRVVAP